MSEVVLKVKFDSVRPMVGSFCGGTKLTIRGDGFSKTPGENRVTLGDRGCIVLASSETELICQVEYKSEVVPTPASVRPAQVVVSVLGNKAKGPAGPAGFFVFSAAATPTVSTFGPTTGQGGDLLTFEGGGFGGNVALSIGGEACEIRQVSDISVECIPGPRETSMQEIQMYTGPARGYACPGPQAPSMKFMYNLNVQSVRAADFNSAAGPGTGGPPGGIVIVGQGLSDGDVFSLCSGAVECVRSAPVAPDDPMLHEGDSSYRTASCTPGPLPPPPAVVMTLRGPKGRASYGGYPATYNVSCDLMVSAADGVVRQLTPNAWTYVFAPYPGSPTSLPALPLALLPSPAPMASPAPPPTPAPATPAPAPAPKPSPLSLAPALGFPSQPLGLPLGAPPGFLAPPDVAPPELVAPPDDARKLPRSLAGPPPRGNPQKPKPPPAGLMPMI